MKNKILTFAITGVIAVMSLSVSAQESKKAAKARKEVAEAKKDLKEAKVDSAADFHRFKKEAELRINDNQKKIAELKAKKSNDTKEVREKYDQKVLAIEKNNNELKKRIKESNSTKTSMWASFKKGFNHDMKAVENAIKNI
ncbi:MAG TPA: hypothetical protein VGQ59_06590 [Cyclobacteriaceae bacterium]|jgi:predicted class III extradiol MEMO1 family dioxygenase|nr:hypothetical protein [Cyclobacteriaceae bacterium]